MFTPSVSVIKLFLLLKFEHNKLDRLYVGNIFFLVDRQHSYCVFATENT